VVFTGLPEGLLLGDWCYLILDMLMYAQMRGNDQGIVKLIGKGMPRHERAQSPVIERETPTTAIINADLSMEAIALEQAVGMVMKTTKMTEAIRQAKRVEGVGEVLVPGERGDRIRAGILDSDEIEVEEILLNSLIDVLAEG